MNRFLLIGLSSSLVLGPVACQKNAAAGRTSPASSGATLATVGGRTITEGDLELRYKEMPPQMRMRANTPEKRKEVLEDSIKMELLVQEARRRGMDKDPEVQRTMDRFMAQRLVKDVFAESQLNAPSDEDVKNYYQTHPDEFARPERYHVVMIMLPAPKGDASRPKLKAELEKWRKDILAKEAKGTRTAFEDTLKAKQQSDPGLHVAGGDMGSRTRAEVEQVLQGSASAVLSLQNDNDISPVTETDRGVALYKLVNRTPAGAESLDASKQRISMRLSQERRNKALDEFVANLRKNGHVEVNEKALAETQVGATPAGGPPGSTGMMMGGPQGGPPGMMVGGPPGTPHPMGVPGMHPGNPPPP